MHLINESDETSPRRLVPSEQVTSFASQEIMDTTTDRRNLDDEQDKNSQDQGDSDDNKTLYEENTVERRVAIKQRTVVKTYPNESQLFQRPDGTIVYPYWAQERLRNEAATLALIAEKTTIPVPKGRLYMENGILHLETNRITEGVLMGDLDKDVRPSAVAAVDKQIQEDILPQLRSLRRNFIGSADPGLPVFPPSRVYRLDRRLWQRVTSDTDEFVLCHNDLGPQNIIVDPDDNFRIVAILDWEFAGFFPSYFEVPLWRSLDRTATSDLYAAVQDRELAFFGLKRGDLKECTADRPPFGWGSKA